MSALWVELRAAIARLNYQSERISQLEAMVKALEQQLREARGY